jgi:membrane protease YdiL (CAAX protease family)/tetratricopeptide (TPR) repeat protein
MEPDIFLIVAGKPTGPYSTDQVRRAVESGSVSTNTLASRKGDSEWLPVNQIIAATLKAPSTASNPNLSLLQSLHDRLASQPALERLGLKGEVAAGEIGRAAQALGRQLDGRIQDDSDPEVNQIAQAIRNLLRDAVNQLSDPKERYIIGRASDLGVDPSTADNRSYLESLYFKDKGFEAFEEEKWHEALPLLDKLIEAQPNNWDAVWRQAVTLYRCDPLRTQEALARLRSTINEAPNNPAPLRALGELTMDLGRRGEAIDLLKQALALKPSDKATRAALATALGTGGSTDSATTESKQKKTNKKGEKTRLAEPSSDDPHSDGLGLIKVAAVFALTAAFLFQAAHTSPDPCFPAGDQEYLYDPGTYYDYTDPKEDATVQNGCPGTLRPGGGKTFYGNYEKWLLCRDREEKINPDVSDEEVHQRCVRTPFANPQSQHASAASFWYVRRGSLLGLGLLAILILGSGAGVLGRLQRVGWHVDGNVGVAVILGLVLGLLAPTQFILGSLGGVMGLTVFHVFAEEVFFRGFITRKLLDTSDNPMLALLLSALLFGLYHLTYTNFWWMALPNTVSQVGMVTIGAGLPYAWLYVRSQSIWPSFLCHLIVNGLMMYASVNSVTEAMGG